MTFEVVGQEKLSFLGGVTLGTLVVGTPDNVWRESLVSSLLAGGIGKNFGCNLKTLEKNQWKDL